MVHKEFLGGDKPTPSDFIEILSEVLDTPGINRSDVEEFVRSKLNVNPTQAHIDLCQVRWRAIFTTNYDDIVETAYRIAPKRAQERCDAIFDSHFARIESDYMEVVRLFKLMGSVKGTGRKTKMALSRSDYHRKLQQRDGLFRQLKDFAKDGTIIYIGYSFGDLIVKDILSEIEEEIPIDEMPWGWALLPSWDEKTEQMLRERRIIPIQMTFEEFVSLSVSMIDEGPSSETSGVIVTVANVSVEIPKSDLNMYRRQFEIHHDELGSKSIPDKNQAIQEFLEGQSDPWLGIFNGWAFKRVKNEEIYASFHQQVGKVLERECPIVLTLGPAGSGKSIAARMLAREIYINDGLPCILLSPETEKIDYRVIDSFARFISESVESVKEMERRLPLVIIIDEAAARIQDVRRLPQYLVSRGIPAVLLAFARENEWKLAKGDYPLKVDSTITIPDELESEKEAEELIDHLRMLGILESAQDNEYWINIIKTEFENSFWDTLYHLVHPARPPLTLSVRNEYDRLVPVAQVAYQYICAFYQFGVPLDLELLARSLHRSYEEFIQSVYDPASLNVIIEMPEQISIRYRARTRMIAEQIGKYVYQSSDELLSELEEIVSNVIPNNVNEVETIRSLLIRRLGPNGTHRITPDDRLIPVFEAAFKAGMMDSATLHHCALLLLSKGDYNGAESYLNQAIEVLNNPNELTHFKTEWRQMIDNSLASVAVRRGLDLQNAGNEGAATKQFSRAVGLFKQARKGEFPNAYPYYGEAWMMLRRSENVAGSERFSLLAEALQIIDESEGNIGDDGRSSLAELESRIVETISGIPSVDTVLSGMVASGDENGGYLLARYNIQVYGQDDKSSTIYLNKAYSIVMEALSITPGHIPCLRLTARLHKKLYPDDWEGWLDLLQRREHFEGTNSPNSLLFDLALAKTQLADYKGAWPHLEQLERESIGHPRRSGVVATIKDSGKDRRIIGEVKTGLTRSEGWLQCDAVGQDIKFLPLRQKFTASGGQTVTFVLAMNYRGYFAIELRPM